ncbi:MULTISPECIES: DUF3006 domain-containing protein [unclassified Sporosarcina]|uniref:DUF3006 domain-containing protein n=1 Tax=unclassified Sporosarcina TaxID=2647733 RepID=UPI002040E1AA|nr:MULTISPECIES: DUF3006 domain-containing protein [unclassified Sporosarcina]GKV67282.1 hypothetical protein NCCP2331_34350 [Sporosarcina sp. NCCP-2331]GLB57621.1 hypothetical protein NCCP2378_34110 [Sporosarcina sp. NCCP-2378]
MERREIGYIDRMEDGRFAVLLVEDTGEEFIADVTALPEGAKEGVYVTITLVDDKITELVINRQETEVMEKKIEEQLKKVKSRSKGSRFKRG